METLYTITEVAKIFKVSRQAIWSKITDGKIQAFRIGKLWRIPQSEIDKIRAGGEDNVD